MRTSSRLANAALLLVVACTLVPRVASAFDTPPVDFFDLIEVLPPFPGLDEAEEPEEPTIAARYEKAAAEIDGLLERARALHRDAVAAHGEIASALEPVTGNEARDAGDVAFVLAEAKAAESRAGEAGQEAIRGREVAEKASAEACRRAAEASDDGTLDGARAARGRAAAGATEAAESATRAQRAAEEAGALARRLRAAIDAAAKVPSVKEARRRADGPKEQLGRSLAGLREVRRVARSRFGAMEDSGADVWTPAVLERARKSTAEIDELTSEVERLARAAADLEARVQDVPPGEIPDPKEVDGIASSAEFAAGFASKESDRARHAADAAQTCVDRAWAGPGDDTREAGRGAGGGEEDFEDLFADIEDDAFQGIEGADARQRERGRRDRDRVRTAAARAARDSDAYTRDVEAQQAESFDDFSRRVAGEVDIAEAESARRQARRQTSTGSAGGLGGAGTGLGLPAGGTTTPAGRGGTSGDIGRVASGGAARFFLSCSRYTSCEIGRLRRAGASEEDLAKARRTIASMCPPIMNGVGYPTKKDCVDNCRRGSDPQLYSTCDCICEVSPP